MQQKSRKLPKSFFYWDASARPSSPELQQKPDLHREPLKTFPHFYGFCWLRAMNFKQPDGSMDLSLPTCGDTQCNSHGSCVPPKGGGTNLVCDCDLGYRGEFCDDTVNGDLSLPLTISVVVVIVGLLILAFTVAKLRQRQKQNRKLKAADIYC